MYTMGIDPVTSVLLLSTISRTAASNLTQAPTSLHKHNGRACCALMEESNAASVYYPGETIYKDRTESYWSVTAQLEPSCYVLPKNTEEVSSVIKTLAGEEACNFAVRSGGHSSVAGSNNVDNGVTIDLGLLNGTTWDRETGIAHILPATQWLHVYEYLDKFQAGLPGGQLGHVGTGGLLTGGGASHYMSQVGFACDSIVNAEVLLASGEIINANASSHHDMWQAIKGGGRLLGVITRFDMQTFRVTPIWGGDQVHRDNEATTDAYIKALKQWVDSAESYPFGYAGILWSRRLIEKEDQIIATLADTSGTVEPSAFSKFRAITNKLSDNMSITNMSTMAQATQAEGLLNVWWTLTIKNTEDMIRMNVDFHRQMVEELEQGCSKCDFETQAFFQPLPSIVSKRGVERGGNILGLEGQTDNAIILLASVAVKDSDHFALARDKVLKWKALAEEHGNRVEGVIPYLYMNYADGSQDVVASYGNASVSKLRNVAKKYDPDGLFRNRIPGAFRIPGL